MAKDSRIPWCDDTFNPWLGCRPVSRGCDNCYAERMNRHRKWVSEWGTSERKRTSAQYWQQPKRWAPGRKVFVGSLCDVFDP